MKIAVIPDLQVRPRAPLHHCTWISRYLAGKNPDVVVMLGDLWDMSSLSSYDKGKRTAEGRRVNLDFAAGVEALTKLTASLPRTARKIFLEGNHEERIRRYSQDNPAIDTLPSVRDAVHSLGWEFHPYLKPVRVGGVAFAHNFPKNAQGRVSRQALSMGPPSAIAMVKANMESCVMGHRQGLETAIYCAGRRTYRGIIAGSAYPQSEAYLGPEQTYWRGILILNEVRNGNFNLMEVSLDYLKRRFGGGSN